MSPCHEVVDGPADDGVVEHSHVDVNHTDGITNLCNKNLNVEKGSTMKFYIEGLPKNDINDNDDI